jgi:hypothetical protein
MGCSTSPDNATPQRRDHSDVFDLIDTMTAIAAVLFIAFVLLVARWLWR